MFQGILIAGFGGQGVLSTGQLLAYAGMLEDKHVAWIPSYGPEMRGGTANCGVTISDIPISSPVVTEPTVLIAMNRPSLEKFEPKIVQDGIALINSSLVDTEVQRDDIKSVYINANELAEEIGNSKIANNIILGALVEMTGVVSGESVVESLKKVLPPKRHNLIDINREALEKGKKLAEEARVKTAM
ncbi:MAG: 2-oxoacid:acceptor oxidoreductase family protein [Clostridiales bacterium]|nr:2-oxoacid:acceptor oxidoreductase family protein [Clostridiales bacterium]MCF8021202.1 2-oxoacid:acceptor oxidoreductase family protein [Clostridiales bacterium]